MQNPRTSAADSIKAWNEILDQSKRKVFVNGTTTEVDNYFGRPQLGKILILPRQSAQLFEYHKPWACISICEADDNLPNATINEANRVGLLRLRFDDIETPRKNYSTIVPEQAKSVWEFTRNVWPHIDLLMIHCAAGISRSSAVGKSISEHYQPTWTEYFDALYSPNRLVCKLMKECNG